MRGEITEGGGGGWVLLRLRYETLHSFLKSVNIIRRVPFFDLHGKARGNPDAADRRRLYDNDRGILDPRGGNLFVKDALYPGPLGLRCLPLRPRA